MNRSLQLAFTSKAVGSVGCHHDMSHGQQSPERRGHEYERSECLAFGVAGGILGGPAVDQSSLRIQSDVLMIKGCPKEGMVRTGGKLRPCEAKRRHCPKYHGLTVGHIG